MRQEELVIRKAELENDDWETFLMQPARNAPVTSGKTGWLLPALPSGF